MLSEGAVCCLNYEGKCCSPVMCACVSAASSSSSQVLSVNGTFTPFITSAPVAIRGARTVAAERSPPVCEGERVEQLLLQCGWDGILFSKKLAWNKYQHRYRRERDWQHKAGSA